MSLNKFAVKILREAADTIEASAHGAVGGVVCSVEALKRFLGDGAQGGQIETESGSVAVWY